MALSRGCTIALIIVAILVVIVIAIGIIIYANWDSIKDKFIGTITKATQEEILKDVPEGYSENDVKRIFADLKVAIENGTIDQAEMQELINYYQTAMADRTIDREEGRTLLGIIQKAMDQVPPTIEEEPFDTIMDSLEVVPEGG